MKRLILFLVFPAFSVPALSQAQKSIFQQKASCIDLFLMPPDPSPNAYLPPPVDGLDKLFTPQKDILFEFSLSQYPLETSSQTIFILTLTRDKKWTARYFEHRDDQGKLTTDLREQKVDQEQAGSLWCILKELQVTTLPDSRTLASLMQTYQLDTLTLPYSSIRRTSMNDGILYHFSMRTPDTSRYYNYGNPNTLLKQFSNVRELYLAASIVAVVKKYVKRPAVVY